MTSHELAALLLKGPDLPVVTCNEDSSCFEAAGDPEVIRVVRIGSVKFGYREILVHGHGPGPKIVARPGDEIEVVFLG